MAIWVIKRAMGMCCCLCHFGERETSRQACAPERHVQLDLDASMTGAGKLKRDRAGEEREEEEEEEMSRWSRLISNYY